MRQVATSRLYLEDESGTLFYLEVSGMSEEGVEGMADRTLGHLQRCIVIVFLASTVGLASGCATTYQEQAFTGGYRELALNDQQYRVSFRGNAFTTSDNAYLFFLTRGAELAKQSGYQHFYLTAISDETTLSQVSTPGRSQTVTTGSISGTYQDLGGYGQVYGQILSNSTTTYTPPQTYDFTKPAFSGQVLFVDGPLENAPAPFHADTILRQGLERNERIERRNRIRGTVFWGGLGLVLIGAAAGG